MKKEGLFGWALRAQPQFCLFISDNGHFWPFLGVNKVVVFFAKWFFSCGSWGGVEGGASGCAGTGGRRGGPGSPASGALAPNAVLVGNGGKENRHPLGSLRYLHGLISILGFRKNRTRTLGRGRCSADASSMASQQHLLPRSNGHLPASIFPDFFFAHAPCLDMGQEHRNHGGY